MDAPGWSELVSAQINEPQLAATVQKTRADTQETTARSQLLDTQNQDEQVKLDLDRAQSPSQKAAIRRAQIAQTLSLIDWTDPDAAEKGDAALQALVDAGNPDARQFIGKLTKDKQERWTAAYGADSPLAAMDAMNGGGGGPQAAGPGGRGAAAAGGGATGVYTPQQMQTAISQMKPDQLKTTSLKMAGYKAGLAAIDNSQHPEQEFARQASALGHPEWADPSYFANPMIQHALGQLRANVAAWDGVIGGQSFASGLGIPAPQVPNEVKEAGGVIYGVNPQGTRATALTPAPRTIVGVDPDTGAAIYSSAQGESVGTHRLGPKPGTASGSGGVFERKHDLYLQLHPGDEQGALDYAAGRGGAKAMTPVQIQMAANAAAARDVANGTITGDQQAEQARMYASQYTVLNAQTAGGGGEPAPDAFSPARARMAGAWRQAAGSVSSIANRAPGHPALGTARGALGDVEKRALQLPPMQGATPPPPNTPFARALKEGKLSVAPNGQGWTVRDGQPVRLF